MLKTPLSAGAYGDDVSALHRSVLQVGMQIPESELNRRFFGPATRQALRTFQNASNLTVTGVLDPATAAALSGQGASSQPPPSPLAAPSPAPRRTRPTW